jgi:excisionase family DNA binding protein
MGAPEAADYLGVVLRTLYKFLDEGVIPAYKLGRVIRLKREDIDAFLESQRIVPGSLSHLYPPQEDHRGENDEDEASGLSLAALTVSVAQAGQMLGISRAEAFGRASWPRASRCCSSAHG